MADKLFNKVKNEAHKRRTTMASVLEEALSHYFVCDQHTGFKLKKHAFGHGGLVDGLTEGDWPSLRERAYEGRGG